LKPCGGDGRTRGLGAQVRVRRYIQTMAMLNHYIQTMHGLLMRAHQVRVRRRLRALFRLDYIQTMLKTLHTNNA
jgi:hypothetical protein